MKVSKRLSKYWQHKSSERTNLELSRAVVVNKPKVSKSFEIVGKNTFLYFTKSKFEGQATESLLFMEYCLIILLSICIYRTPSVAITRPISAGEY